MRLLQLVAVIAWATHTSSCSAAPRPPKVTLDLGAFTGVESGDITEFLGIPFASARRFRLPQAVGLYLGRYDATAFGPSCPQQVSGMPDPITDTSEDCLTINVVKPTQDSKAKLPVVVWIYGGGFQIGGTVQYNGSSIVSRSIQLGEPVIYVSFNYRLSGFGFLASKEVKKAGVGNLGMHDQIMALRWVQRYIDTFGGDPKKVTIWGESAGAISVALHMLVNDGDNRDLFRAGFMQSGSPPAILGLENGQQYYDDVVKKTDCAKSADTLDCLRAVDYNILKEAIDSSAPSLTDFQSFPLAWQPRVDNVLFSDNPQRLVQKGKVANIPIVTGDCDDEGTLFALAQTNLSTDAHFKEWIKKFALPTAPEQEIDRLLELYPADPTQGSPFDTGTDNTITPQFKRFAAFLGDIIFQAPRRFFLEELPKKQDTYAFLSKRSKSVPVMGASHGSDIALAFGGDMADYLIRFAATLNPNGDTGISWPKWTVESRDMLLFEDGDVPLSITQDTYREEAIKAVVKVFLEHPV